MLDEPVKDGESLKINGSVMMAAADSPDEIMEHLKNDVYAKEVWDLEKVQIIPVSQYCSSKAGFDRIGDIIGMSFMYPDWIAGQGGNTKTFVMNLNYHRKCI